MHFSIIYSFEVPTCESVADHRPPKHKKLWDLTEAHTEDGYKHRKYAAVLNKEQFLEFLEELELAYDSETMGMIGAPGFGISWMPAVSFMGRNGHYRNAYICPIPDLESPYMKDEKKFTRYVERGLKALSESPR